MLLDMHRYRRGPRCPSLKVSNVAKLQGDGTKSDCRLNEDSALGEEQDKQPVFSS